MKAIMTILAASVLLASCSKSSIRGEGAIITETRNVPAFTSVRVEGSREVSITRGTTTSVRVTGYQNLVPIYETFVSNGTLVVKHRNDYLNIRNDNIKVDITVPTLDGASINGSGEINIRDFVAQELAASINGSGTIRADNCDYQRSYYEVNGSGDILARNNVAGRVEARISGSGKIETTALISLMARISGSGDVHYWGDPTTVDVQVSGSGKAVKR